MFPWGGTPPPPLLYHKENFKFNIKLSGIVRGSPPLPLLCARGTPLTPRSRFCQIQKKIERKMMAKGKGT